MGKVFLSICFCAICLLSFAQSTKILFIGNSYTYVNNLPSLIKNVSHSNGHEIEYSSNTPGGCTFQNHLSSSASYILQGGWDYVVLQEQSQLPSFPDGQFYNECYPYARQLCEMVRQYSPDAKIIFYMTWGRKYGDEQNCQYFEPLCTYEGMDSLLYLRYMTMAQDNHTLVSPVGRVWHYIRDNNPEIELYQSDNSHPSLAGSYVAACCFNTILFNEDPNTISYNPGLDNQQISVIKNAVKRVVFDSLENWSFLPSDDTLSINNYANSSIRIFPNPATNNLNISFTDNFNEECLFSIFDIFGKELKKYSGFNGQTATLDISSLSPGLYVLQVYNKNNVVISNRKFFKVE